MRSSSATSSVSVHDSSTPDGSHLVMARVRVRIRPRVRIWVRVKVRVRVRVRASARVRVRARRLAQVGAVDAARACVRATPLEVHVPLRYARLPGRHDAEARLVRVRVRVRVRG